MLFFALFLTFLKAEIKYSYCVKKDSGYVISDDEHSDYIVKGALTENVKDNGWYKIHIVGVDQKSDEDLMYCAGFVEGYLNQEGMFNHFQLIKDIKKYNRNKKEYAPKEIYNFMTANLKYVRESVAAYSDDPYWVDMGLILKQFDGLKDGYQYRINEIKNDTMSMSEFDHWFFQSAGDMFDLAEIYPDPNPAKEFREHCSGMVKLTENYDDIFFAHDAWSDFRELHGELKDMYLPVSRFNAKRVVLSTRVGKISSYDDFYLADSGLYVLETTLNNYNEDLYKVVVPQSLFTWMRAYYSTWVAKNGSDWAKTFIRHNSGTYNNQYVIVDTNKFVRYEKPTTDLLWIIEQFPGLYRMTDVTSQLVNDLYFPSVNTPWHEDLYELAGYPELVKSMGIYGSYRSSKGPRYQLMVREAPRIKTFEDFQKFMRYNNYARDPYSQGDPAQQILSRYDLREDSTPYGARNNFGGLDTKCLRHTEAKTKLQMHALASPVHGNGIPVWNFQNYAEKYHVDLKFDGLPNEWDFNWTQFGPEDYDICKFVKSDKNSKDSKSLCFKRSSYCGWCTYDQTCYPGEKTAPFFDQKCPDGWEVEQKEKAYAIPLIVSVSVIVVIFCLIVYLSHFLNLRSKKSAILLTTND
ncbi:hypothetical protein M9Y10_004882 [Tritrichomonas musculus]|uniref:Phospholipase B-like n=1 Tax=Tritrichomonas musculus TaxID=1915356 RepID=A0ABR2JKN5_9EUKA